MARIEPIRVNVPLDGTTLTAHVDVILTRQFHVRMWLGMQLLKMAAWVLGCNFIFDRGDEA